LPAKRKNNMTTNKKLRQATSQLRIADKKHAAATAKLLQAYRDYGIALRAWRESQNMSLRCLAKWLQVSPAYLSDVERGNRHPTERITLKFLA